MRSVTKVASVDGPRAAEPAVTGSAMAACRS